MSGKLRPNPLIWHSPAVPGKPMLRAQVSFAAMWAGECAFMVALGVVAYREGGVGAVGAVTAARMACAALLAPFLATLADRVRRERVLTGVGMVRAAMLGSAAVVTATGGPALATYGLAVIATIAMTMYRPAHSALLPGLAKSPQELAGANAVRGMLDSLSTLGGPLVAAVLLAASGPSAVFVVCAAASLLAAVVVVGLPYDAPPRAADSGGAPGRVVLQGFAAIVGDRGLALITGLGLVQTFTRGCLTVFTVVVAIDLLGTGDPGVGVLNAAIGAGRGSRFDLCLRACPARGPGWLVRTGHRVVRCAVGADRGPAKPGGGRPSARRGRDRQRTDRRGGLHAAGPAG